MINVTNKLRVCHFPQVPCKPFLVEVENEREAYLIEKTLADQHLFLFDNNMIPDYSNAITVDMWEEDSDGEGTSEWVSYYNYEEEMDWDEFREVYLETI
jgi:hypothetical protein